MIPIAAALGILGAGIKILGTVDEIDKNNERHNLEMELERKREKTARYTQYAETAANVVGVLGKLYLEYQRDKASQQSQQAQEHAQESIPKARQAKALPPPPAINPINSLAVDTNSIWVNDSTQTIGAVVVDNQSGRGFQYAYYMQQVNENVQNIFESVDGSPWHQIGILDFQKMSPSDFGTPKAGGPIFAEIFLTAINRYEQGTNKAPAQIPQYSSAKKISLTKMKTLIERVQKGDVNAMKELGDYYRANGKNADAVKWYKSAAKGGNRAAQSLLRTMNSV